MQKIFCDDGSTFVKLAYADEQKKLVTKITETSFLAGNWNFAFGQNIYNYEIYSTYFKMHPPTQQKTRIVSPFLGLAVHLEVY